MQSFEYIIDLAAATVMYKLGVMREDKWFNSET